MSWPEDFIQNFIVLEPSIFSLEQLIVVSLSSLVLLVAAMLVFIRLRKNLKRMNQRTVGGNDLKITLLGPILIILSVFLDQLIILVTGYSILLGGFGPAGFVYAGGLLIFVIFYASYTTGVVSLSSSMKNIYKWVNRIMIIMTCICIILAVFNLQFLFIIAMILILFILVLTMFFSLRDFFMISNRLQKVRHGMSILAGACLLLHAFFMILYQVTQSVPVRLIFLLVLPVINLILYWSYFIPLKIQEWTGILPPSYRVLREKQRQLTKKASLG